MEKQQLRKNRLDLEYHGEAQKTNAFLILLTTGLLGFSGTFIWLQKGEMFYLGLTITFLIFLGGLLLYRRSGQRMKQILVEVENIE